jgi:hypothetical protein
VERCPGSPPGALPRLRGRGEQGEIIRLSLPLSALCIVRGFLARAEEPNRLNAMSLIGSSAHHGLASEAALHGQRPRKRPRIRRVLAS